jgi:hypothetical protein
MLYIPFKLIVKFENVAMPVVVLKLTVDDVVERVPFELHLDKLSIDRAAFHV